MIETDSATRDDTNNQDNTQEDKIQVQFDNQSSIQENTIVMENDINVDTIYNFGK